MYFILFIIQQRDTLSKMWLKAWSMNSVYQQLIPPELANSAHHPSLCLPETQKVNGHLDMSFILLNTLQLVMNRICVLQRLLVKSKTLE